MLNKPVFLALALTMFLGLFFLLIQFMEYTYAGFSLYSGNFGALFYVLTGFHGFHVIFGRLFLLSSLLGVSGFCLDSHISFQCSA